MKKARRRGRRHNRHMCLLQIANMPGNVCIVCGNGHANGGSTIKNGHGDLSTGEAIHVLPLVVPRSVGVVLRVTYAIASSRPMIVHTNPARSLPRVTRCIF